jgi:hypothetical protein
MFARTSCRWGSGFLEAGHQHLDGDRLGLRFGLPIRSVLLPPLFGWPRGWCGGWSRGIVGGQLDAPCGERFRGRFRGRRVDGRRGRSGGGVVVLVVLVGDGGGGVGGFHGTKHSSSEFSSLSDSRIENRFSNLM